MFFVDTETLGFVGPVILIQWAEDDGPIHLHEVWRRPVRETLELIERYADSEVCMFNCVFDHWMIQRCYDVLRLMDPSRPPSGQAWVDLEHRAIRESLCVKPKAALDLMLYAQKGEFQGLMARKPIWIRRVPTALADPLAQELGSRITFDSIYFERRQDGYQWQVQDVEGRDDVKDVVLRFGARSRLKSLAAHCLDSDPLDAVPTDLFPKMDEWNWPNMGPVWLPRLQENVDYWATNEEGRKYAEEDVRITRGLWRYFGEPAAGDNDSELAIAVASSRWRGFAVDLGLVRDHQEQAALVSNSAPKDWRPVLAGLHERMSEIEALGVTGTDKASLERVMREFPEDHAAHQFAAQVTAARSAEKLEDLCSKILTVGRAHPAFKVLGAKSGRMSGTGGISYHGIPKGDLRSAFTLADHGLSLLGGGDFDSFEVAIFAAIANDPQLTADLQEKDMHRLRASAMYRVDYADVSATQRKRAKNSLFASLYGAQLPKIAQTLDMSEAEATTAEGRFAARYPGVGRMQKEVYDKFCSMRQPGGIGTPIYWHDPAPYMESLLGFKRFFDLENRVCHSLFELAQNPPESLRNNIDLIERRSGRVQTAGGALQSALYGCAFQIQAANMRQAGNHRIQSTGAEITKAVQRRIWDLQPSGIGPWVVSTMQIHDEILACYAPGVDVKGRVAEAVGSFRDVVPLISMDFKTGISNWSER